MAKVLQTWPARLAQSAYSAATLPGEVLRNPDTAMDVLSGARDMSHETFNRATDLASLPAVQLPLARPGSVGIFGGRLAQNAPLDDLVRAERLAASGATRDKIWRDTGWFKGPDGQWRFEIPDNRAYSDAAAALGELREIAKAEGRRIGPEDTLPLGGVMGHRDLYAAYPQIENMPVRFSEPSSSAFGSYSGASRSMTLRPDIASQPTPSRILHEGQHAVQHIEGFARGGNLAGGGVGDYLRTAGEVEARNVQARMAMTPEQRRRTPPWRTQDTPDDQQILRGSLDDALRARAVPPLSADAANRDALIAVLLGSQRGRGGK